MEEAQGENRVKLTLAKCGAQDDGIGPEHLDVNVQTGLRTPREAGVEAGRLDTQARPAPRKLGPGAEVLGLTLEGQGPQTA